MLFYTVILTLTDPEEIVLPRTYLYEYVFHMRSNQSEPIPQSHPLFDTHRAPTLKDHYPLTLLTSGLGIR